MKVLVLFYSCYGHTFEMAKAMVEGAKSIENTEVTLMRVPETLPQELLEKIGASEPQKAFADIPVVKVKDLVEYDALIFGAPTRYGMIASQMKAFIDGTGSLWAKGSLVGKIGSAFTSSQTQHGGQETTILGMHTVFLHLGMMIVGLPYSFAGQSTMKEVAGNSPYGASTIVGKGRPNQYELDGAFYQGAHVAKMLARMK